MGLFQLRRDRRDHRAQYHGLEALWQRVAAFYPELVLDRRSFVGRQLGPVTDYASATYRRYVECRDGLTRLQITAGEAPGLQRRRIVQSAGGTGGLCGTTVRREGRRGRLRP
ncbi:DUF6545 domain-containing protein [Kitasatospora sp. NPDC048722]|uniref:DUF6545 domain-containing protein n=1 Tax=Kitasatospora sp. NPDC048722 TaxID=3155639 RepID=UPI0033C6ED7A